MTKRILDVVIAGLKVVLSILDACRDALYERSDGHAHKFGVGG